MRGDAVALVVLTALPTLAGEVDPVAAAAMRHGLSVALVRAVVHVESRGNPRAVSPKGALGLMQLMPETAKRFGVVDPFDPAESLEGGCRYLAWLLERFEGDVMKALAGYNAGEGAVERHAGVPPFTETEEYVVRVLSRTRQEDGAAVRREIPRLRQAGLQVAGSAVLGRGWRTATR